MPAFLLDVDESEREDLASLGVTLEPIDSADQVAIKAQASQLLRAMGAVQRELEELNALRQREYIQIDAAYAPQVDRLEKRFLSLQSWVCSLAEIADFNGKKSAKLAFGEFGVRAVPEKVEIIDTEAAIAWAEAEQLEVVEVVFTKKLPHKRVAPLVLERIRAGGDVPAGMEYHAARSVPYAKPAKQLAAER